MPAVSDTSPLIGLAAISRLELLRDQFGSVFIPQAVYAELKIESGFPGTNMLEQAFTDGWVEVKQVQNLPLINALRGELHLGEAEALALAIELEVEMIVMDERDGRSRARMMGLKTVGVLGILLRAKKQGKIKSFAQEMNNLRREIGFFISDELYQELMIQAGENSPF